MTDQGCDVAPMDMSGDIEALVERVRLGPSLVQRYWKQQITWDQYHDGMTGFRAALTELAERARERDWIKERHGQQADRANALKAQRDEWANRFEIMAEENRDLNAERDEATQRFLTRATQLKAQRDELVEALERIERNSVGLVHGIATDALAKVRGEAK